MELRPDTQVDGSSSKKAATFSSRPSDAGSHTIINTSSEPRGRSKADQDEIDALNKRILQLAEELRETKENASQLQNEVESLTQTNENLVYTNQNLKSELQQA